MSAPLLSANVPPDQRVRLTYRIEQNLLSSRGYEQAAATAVTDAWRNSGQAVVLAPATTPEQGGASLLGVRESFTTIDLKTNHQLPTVSWDRYLQPYRRVKASALDFVGAELVDVDQLAATGSTAAARTATAQAAAGASRSSSGTAAALVRTTTARLVLVAALVLAVVLVVKYGRGRAA